MNRGIISLLAFVWCCGTYAQNSYDEILHLSYDYFSRSTFINTNTGLSRQQMNLAGGFGFKLNSNEDLLTVGLSYQWLKLRPEVAIQPALNIHSTSLDLGYLKHWKNPTWASTISVGMAAVSDYKSAANSTYQTSLSAMLHHGKSNNLIWTFGLFYSDQPFGPWFFPILGVDWNITDKLYLSTILLDYAYLEYAITPNVWYAGVDIRAMGMSFVISDYENHQNSYVTSFSESFPFYPYTLTIFNDFYLKESISIFFKGGLLASRENKHYTQDHQPLNSIYNNTISPSFYLNMGIAMRFRRF